MMLIKPGALFAASSLRNLVVLGTLAVGTLALSACGGDSNNNSPPQIGPGTVVYGVRGDAELVKFSPQAPGTVVSVGNIAVGNGEKVVGLDFRPGPANGGLYAATSTGRLLLVDPETALGTAIQPIVGPGTGLTGNRIGVDFNPAADALRIIGDDGLNLRVPTAALTAPAPAVAVNTFVDRRMGYLQGVTAAAYTNSDDGENAPTTTELFVIDTDSDTLHLQQNANDGGLVARGSLGVNATNAPGYDIFFINGGTNEHYALLTVGGATNLYTINPTTGAATATGAALPAGTYRGLIVDNDDLEETPNMRNVVALREEGSNYFGDFFLLDASAGTLTPNLAEPSFQIVLPTGEQLIGFDVRSTSREPDKDSGYAVARSGAIYALTDETTLVATISGATLAGTEFGVDFNPRADLLRIVSNTGQNLRVNLQEGRMIAGSDGVEVARASGFAFVDGTTRVVSTAPQIVATAYRSANPGMGNFQYALDARDSSLYRVSVPNDGALVRVGSLNVSLPANATGAAEQSFDISGASDGTVLAALRAAGQSQSTLYNVNLDTGAAAFLGVIGSAGPVNAITARVEQ